MAINSDVEDSISAYEDMLSRHVARHGYPAAPQTSIDEYMGMSREELRRLTSQDLDEIAFLVNSAAFSVADEYNRQKALKERCRTVLAALVGHKLDSSVYNNNDKWMLAAKRDEKAWAYWQKMQQCDTVCLRLEGQSIRLAEMVKILTSIKFNR